MNDEIHKFKLTSPQKQLYSSDKRIRAMFSGRGSGKSFLSAIVQMTYALNNDHVEMMIIGPTAGTVRNVNIKNFLQVTPGSTIADYNKSTNEIFMINGSHLMFRSANSERDIDNTLRGPSVHFCAIDEIAVMSPYVWSIILPMVREGTDAQQKIFITSTPRMNWIYKKFKQSPPSNYFMIDEVTSHSNTNLTDGFIKSLEDEFGGTPYYESEIEGKWVSQTGLVYIIPIINHVEIPELHFMSEFRYSIDFGFTAECAILVYGRYKNQWFMIGENYERGMTDEAVSNQMHVYYSKYGKGRTICDAAQPQSIQYLKDHGINAEPGAKGKDIGVRTTRNMLDALDLQVSDKCLNTIYEGSNFIYAKDDSDDKFTGVRHCMDSMEYFCMSAQVSKTRTGFK